MGRTERPTLTGEKSTTTVRVEVDVPRELYEEEVERAKRVNSLPGEDWSFDTSRIEGGLIDQIDLDIRHYVDGEEVFVGVPEVEETEE